MSEKRLLTCHCDKVKIEVTFDNGIENIRRCNCSLCRRKGYVMASVPLANLCVIEGHDHLNCYQWNTHVAKHYFCQHCGVYTHHQRRSNPTEYGINIACLAGVDPYAYGQVPIGNGNLNAALPEMDDLTNE